MGIVLPGDAHPGALRGPDTSLAGQRFRVQGLRRRGWRPAQSAGLKARPQRAGRGGVAKAIAPSPAPASRDPAEGGDWCAGCGGGPAGAYKSSCAGAPARSPLPPCARVACSVVSFRGSRQQVSLPLPPVPRLCPETVPGETDGPPAPAGQTLGSRAPRGLRPGRAGARVPGARRARTLLTWVSPPGDQLRGAARTGTAPVRR